MSRIIVKNLPKGTKEEKLRSIFGEKGCITDCSLKYTKDGVFRRFAFIGFKSPEEATAAISRFDDSFMGAQRIKVEIANDFGDEKKPRAWSKYSRDSSAYHQMVEKLKTQKEQNKEIKETREDPNLKKKKAKEEKMNELLGNLKDDPRFEEFLEAHKNRKTKATWSDDVQTKTKMMSGSVVTDDKNQTSPEKNVRTKGGTSDSDYDSESPSKAVSDTPPTQEEKLATKKGLSDLEYLKSKMKTEMESDSSDSSSDDEEEEEEGSDTSGDDDSSDEGEDEVKQEDLNSSQNKDQEVTGSITEVQHVIKAKGLPGSVKEEQIREFFAPLVVKNVKIPRSARGKTSFSVATVEFGSDKDTDQAMKRNKSFLGVKRVYLYKMKKEVTSVTQEKPKAWELKSEEMEEDGGEETIAESGRLYVRNLAYVCKEEDLEEHFGKYGPLVEVNLPVDRWTRKVKGFAFITFMMPEHAVKAYTELDGTVFQGRMIHILPGKAKKEEEMEVTDEASFKKKKEAKEKAQAGSSHNWNTLFLGANAVADVMADKYGTTKSHILDPSSKQSLGVRMALGETQIVSETRQFLLDHGVSLDAFSQAAAPRSKTTILAKNLPAGTKSEELQGLFERYGSMSKLVLPPNGITAIIEYQEPSEARNGFRNLAYSKFHHVPLYLEWAPVDALKDKSRSSEQDNPEEGTNTGERKPENQQEEESEESEDEIEPESTLFVKNLNFDTTESSLHEKFIKCGPIRTVTISKKKDMKNPGKFLSMGYGFVEFKKRESAKTAMKKLQHTDLDGHQLELKISSRATVQKALPKKRQDPKKKQRSSKLLVRNIPFEATSKEIRELFCVFGELKSVRLPKKMGQSVGHRGFAFVDFLTKQDAKRAFNALCHSTHLYGRRLVLEWAETEESVDQLRKKTAEHFHEDVPSKKLKKSGLLDHLDAAEDAD